MKPVLCPIGYKLGLWSTGHNLTGKIGTALHQLTFKVSRAET